MTGTPHRILYLYGSSSPEGRTRHSIETLIDGTGGEAMDIGTCGITPYDYDAHNTEDAFFKISKKMIEADVIVFATPVYWYAMSAQMKIFFDRLSDLVTVRKPDGRALAGKRTYLIVNGSDEAMPDGFEIPFAKTSEYFDMVYGGAHYVCTGNKHAALVEKSWNDLKVVKERIMSAQPLTPKETKTHA